MGDQKENGPSTEGNGRFDSLEYGESKLLGDFFASGFTSKCSRHIIQVAEGKGMD